MRKIEVIRKQMALSGAEGITLIYSVTIDDMTSDGLVAGLENYGLCIDVPERGESECLRGITTSAASINTLAELISGNLVTPCSLHDVVYDWICEN